MSRSSKPTQRAFGLGDYQSGPSPAPHIPEPSAVSRDLNRTLQRIVAVGPAICVAHLALPLTLFGCAREPVQAEALAWAGFASLNGVDVVAFDADFRRDPSVRFAVVGDDEDIDGVLEGGGVRPTFEEGSGVFEQPAPGSDPDVLVGKSWMTDEIKDSEGETVYRKFVRGFDPVSGQQQLIVWAYET